MRLRRWAIVREGPGPFSFESGPHTWIGAHLKVKLQNPDRLQVVPWKGDGFSTLDAWCNLRWGLG